MRTLIVACAAWLLSSLVSYAADIADTVVRIQNGRFSGGSGTLIGHKDECYLILTCDHLFWPGRGELTVHLRDGTSLPATYLRSHPDARKDCPAQCDLALLTVRCQQTLPVSKVSGNTPTPYGDIWKVGYPGSGGRQQLDVRTGHIQRDTATVWSDIEINPGDSGGAYFDADGELVGVCTLRITRGGQSGPFDHSEGPGLEAIRSFLRAGWD